MIVSTSDQVRAVKIGNFPKFNFGPVISWSEKAGPKLISSGGLMVQKYRYPGTGKYLSESLTSRRMPTIFLVLDYKKVNNKRAPEPGLVTLTRGHVTLTSKLRMSLIY